MKPWEFLPMPPPGPPIPGGLLFGSNGEEEEEEEEESGEEVDRDFRKKMESEGYEPDLVEMGIKVANNHSRTREEALKIGEHYIKEMAK